MGVYAEEKKIIYESSPYSAKRPGDRLYATLHKMPEELCSSFCLFLKS